MRMIVLLSCSLILLSLASSCTNPLAEDRKAILPADSIIPEPVMVQILADVHLLEAGLLDQRNRGMKTDARAPLYYVELFRKYGTTEDNFRLNMQYYQWDSDAYAKLYGKVISELQKRKTWLHPSQSKDQPITE